MSITGPVTALIGGVSQASGTPPLVGQLVQDVNGVVQQLTAPAPTTTSTTAPTTSTWTLSRGPLMTTTPAPMMTAPTSVTATTIAPAPIGRPTTVPAGPPTTASAPLLIAGTVGTPTGLGVGLTASTSYSLPLGLLALGLVFAAVHARSGKREAKLTLAPRTRNEHRVGFENWGSAAHDNWLP